MPESARGLWSSSTLAPLASLALALCLSACDCGGGLGEPCVTDLDCGPGLYCHVKGTCQLIPDDGGTDAAVEDAMSGTDAASSDAAQGTDLGVLPPCGGKAAIDCPPDFYCDFPGDSCDFDDSSGVCLPRPFACDTEYDPVCGCDGIQYSNACAANGNGTDVWPGGTCDPWMSFDCGTELCQIGAEYCVETVPGPGGPSAFTCAPMPLCAIGGCPCLQNVPCGDVCSEDPAGNLFVTCFAP